MSRYHDDYDSEAFPNQALFWEANYERALKGKRGRKALADLRAALLALPEPRLIQGALCTVGATAEAQRLDAEWMNPPPPPGWSRHDPMAGSLRDAIDGQGEGVCAIGAYLWHRKVRAGLDPDEAFASLPRLLQDDHDIAETASEAEAAGVAYVLAWRLAYMNDEWFAGKSPEDRYTAFLAWIDSQLADTAVAS